MSQIVKAPVKDLNLVNALAAAPVTPTHGDTIVVSTNGTWGNLDVEANDIVTWNAYTNTYIKIGELEEGDRFVVGGAGGTAAGPVTAHSKLVVVYDGGTVTTAGNWVAEPANVKGDQVEVNNLQSLFGGFKFDWNGTNWIGQFAESSALGVNVNANIVAERVFATPVGYAAVNYDATASSTIADHLKAIDDALDA